jgi:hypothetical protein
VRIVAEEDVDRSAELDQVRRLLFPELPPDEGWARIEAALEGASDERRVEAIERATRSRDLSQHLLDLLRQRDEDEDGDEDEDV